MKKRAALLIALAIFMQIFGLSVYGRDIRVIIQSEEFECDPEPFIDENNRIQVPFRAIFERLGASVDWNIKTKSIVCIKGDLTITLAVGSDKMFVNGSEIITDSPAVIVDGRTFVPLRAISECMGANVKWDFSSKTAYIDFESYTSVNSDISLQTTEVIEKNITAKGNIPILDAKVSYDVISGRKKGVDKINSSIKDTAEFLIYWGTNSLGNIDDSAIDKYNETGFRNTMEADISLKYADKNYVSYLSSVKYATGGAYPSETRQSGVFDIESGSLLSLNELLDNKEAALEEAKAKFEALISKNPSVYYADKEINMDETYYYLTEKGIVFGFNKQVIAPYSMGFIEIEIKR